MWNLSGRDKATVSCHASAVNAWNYFLETYDHNGTDGDGVKLIVTTNHDIENAEADQAQGPAQVFDLINMGVKEISFISEIYHTLGTPEIMGHEFTHHIIFRNIEGLQINNEWNESFCDIFGIMSDFYFRKQNGLSSGNYIFADGFSEPRSLSNPQSFGDPDHFDKRITVGNLSDVAHTNNGVQNKFFHLLSEGGNGSSPDNNINVFGIGNENAALLTWRVMMNHLTSSPSYTSLRDAYIIEAIAEYGECSFERVQVQNDWAGVGVGEEYENYIEIHGNKTFCVDNTNWYRWTLCSGLPGNFIWTYPQLWDVSIGPQGKTFDILDFNGLEGTPPWTFNITCTNLQTGISKTFQLRIEDCFNNYPPHPCEIDVEVPDRSSSGGSISETSKLKLFPNPANSTVHYQFNNLNLDDLTNIEIYSSHGEIIYSSDKLTGSLDLSRILNTSGIYMIKITSKNGQSITDKLSYVY